MREKPTSDFVAPLVLHSGARTICAAASIGSLVPGFCLTGTDGVVHCAKDWKGSPVLVVAFLCNHCTESQVYEARLNKLAQEYASRGVNLVAIQSSDPPAFSDQDLAWSDVGESLADMEVRAAFRKFRFPYPFDGDTGATARAFGAIFFDWFGHFRHREGLYQPQHLDILAAGVLAETRFEQAS
jgi:hypothetical protein